MTEDQDSAHKQNDKLLVQVPTDIDRDLQWYFERGPNPVLTPKTRERWVPINRAIDDGFRRVCLYYSAISAGKSRHEATAESDPDAYFWDEEEAYDLLRFELQLIVCRLEEFRRSTGRGRPIKQAIGHIVVPLHWFDFDLTTGYEILSTGGEYELVGYGKDGFTWCASGPRRLHQVPIMRSSSADHWRALVIGCNRGAGGRAPIDWSTWGDVRIDAEGVPYVAQALGLDFNAPNILETVHAYLKKLNEQKSSSPKTTRIDGNDGMSDEERREYYYAQREFYRFLERREIPPQDPPQDLLWSRSDNEVNLGNPTTTVTEISDRTKISCTKIRGLLKTFYSPTLAARDEIPVEWLRGSESARFWKEVERLKRGPKTQKVNYREGTKTPISTRNHYAKRKLHKSAAWLNNNTE